jgi:hypothetical protein
MNPVGLFYSAVAVLLIALTLTGFRHFFFHGMSYPGREITPPIRGLVIAHGVVMSAWLLLFLLQPLLVATGYRRVHMAVGKAGVALAIGVVAAGLAVAVNSARVSPPEMKLWGLSPKQFMAVPFIAALLFAAFVGVGIWYRRRPDIHRPMILMGTFAAMSAAISRIDAINNLYLGTVWETVFGPFFATQILCGVLLLIRCAITRSFDRWFAIGFVVLTLACALIMLVAKTDGWNSFASLLVR